VTEKSPTPPNGQDPQLDPAVDADEPAFDWMKPASAGKRAGAPSDGDAAGATEPSTPVAPTTPVARTAPVPPAASTTPAAPAEGTAATAAPARRLAGGRADRRAAETSASDGAFSEPLPTSALQIRPPQEEVERRNAEREHAANAKPLAPRVMQVLLAVCFPIVLLVLAVRAIASPLFLWVEYNRPGFPGDGYGFSTDDRMTYGSYAVDYLSNWAGPRYLGELVNRGGEALFKPGEVSHMADVKVVILSAFGAGTLLLLLSLVAIIYLRRRSPGGVRRGLFAGSIVTLVVILGLGTLAVLGWEQFFTQFHTVFFANGTWTFYLQDTLIRLFPGQFWVDGGIVIGALVLIASLLTLVLTWPTRKRRGLPKRGTVEDAPAAVGTEDAAAAKGFHFRRTKGRNDANPDAGSAGGAATAEATPAPGDEPAGAGAEATDPKGRPARGQASAL
jgi:integral membrane protein (TIGR01906 family)